MKRIIFTFAWVLAGILPLSAMPAGAQSADTPPFPVTIEKQLAARASNYTEVTLDRKMLDFASRFMNKEDDAEGKHIISKLNGIYVRTYEFDKPGQYSADDLTSIRSQFQTADWNPIVKERSRNGSDDSDIYMKVVNGQVQGMFILSAEPKELNFVYLSGSIQPEDLSSISGNFGIPASAGNLSEAQRQQMRTDARRAAKEAQKEAQQP